MKTRIIVECFVCKKKMDKKPIQVRRNKAGVFSCKKHRSEHQKIIGSGKSNKGRKTSEDTKIKLRAARKRRVGELAPAWKGEKAGYFAMHQWIRKQYGAAKKYQCMFCGGTRGSKTIEWANLDGKYSRDPQTWTTLCKICHAAFDGIGLNRERTATGQFV